MPICSFCFSSYIFVFLIYLKKGKKKNMILFTFLKDIFLLTALKGHLEEEISVSKLFSFLLHHKCARRKHPWIPYEWIVLVIVLESINVREEICNIRTLSSATPRNTLRLKFYCVTFFYYEILCSKHVAYYLVVNVLINPYFLISLLFRTKI